MSKVISVYFGFALVFQSQAFSRAWCSLHVFASCSDWFIAKFLFAVIGFDNYCFFFYDTQLKSSVKCIIPYSVKSNKIKIDLYYDLMLHFKSRPVFPRPCSNDCPFQMEENSSNPLPFTLTYIRSGNK